MIYAELKTTINSSDLDEASLIKAMKSISTENFGITDPEQENTNAANATTPTE